MCNMYISGISRDLPDLTHLSCNHHIYMVLAASISCNQKKDAKVAVLGVGGGGLCSFLNKYRPKMKTIGIEIDSEIVEIASKWFGLKRNDTLEIRVQDGLEYLKELGKEGMHFVYCNKIKIKIFFHHNLLFIFNDFYSWIL